MTLKSTCRTLQPPWTEQEKEMLRKLRIAGVSFDNMPPFFTGRSADACRAQNTKLSKSFRHWPAKSPPRDNLRDRSRLLRTRAVSSSESIVEDIPAMTETLCTPAEHDSPGNESYRPDSSPGDATVDEFDDAFQSQDEIQSITDDRIEIDSPQPPLTSGYDNISHTQSQLVLNRNEFDVEQQAEAEFSKQMLTTGQKDLNMNVSPRFEEPSPGQYKWVELYDISKKFHAWIIKFCHETTNLTENDLGAHLRYLKLPPALVELKGRLTQESKVAHHMNQPGMSSLLAAHLTHSITTIILHRHVSRVLTTSRHPWIKDIFHESSRRCENAAREINKMILNYEGEDNQTIRQIISVSTGLAEEVLSGDLVTDDPMNTMRNYLTTIERSKPSTNNAAAGIFESPEISNTNSSRGSNENRNQHRQSYEYMTRTPTASRTHGRPQGREPDASGSDCAKYLVPNQVMTTPARSGQQVSTTYSSDPTSSLANFSSTSYPSPGSIGHIAGTRTNLQTSASMPIQALQQLSFESPDTRDQISELYMENDSFTQFLNSQP